MTTRRWMSTAALLLVVAFVGLYAAGTQPVEVAAVSMAPAVASNTIGSCSDSSAAEPECSEDGAQPGTATCNNCPNDDYCINYCCASGVGRCTMTNKCMCML